MSNSVEKQIKKEIELTFKRPLAEFAVNYALEFEKILTPNFINSLKDLKVIEEKLTKIENSSLIELKEIKDTAKNELKDQNRKDRGARV